MALFVISDLHLSTDKNTNKSMEVFGSTWTDYMNKIKKNWNLMISPDDTVVVSGDISWAMKLDEAYSDLNFIDKLNGQKYLGKGNHDFWWATASKLQKYFDENNFSTLHILYNNAFIVENAIICGSRGWFPDEAQQNTTNDADYDKIVSREVGRLRMSLEHAKRLQSEHLNSTGDKLPMYAFMHFPVVWKNQCIDEIIAVLEEFEITDCFYGHIHGSIGATRTCVYKNISFTLTSSDFLSFYPLKIK